MKKKAILPLVLALAVCIFALTACGSKQAAQQTTVPAASAETSQPTVATPEQNTTETGEIPNIGEVEADKGLLTVTITVPSDFVGETTQEKLDANVADGRYQSAKLNDDGSVTMVMTKAQHNDLLKTISESIDSEISAMVGSSDYPDFTAISANDNYSDFKVTVDADELSLSDSLSVLGFYAFGGMYHAFAGDEVDNIHVSFVNQTTGDVIEEANSKDMAG